MSGRLPDFVVIGAAKAGTTTLHAYLRDHPQVYMAEPKEPEFFARDMQWKKGIKWYRSLFREATRDMHVGEASTKYSNDAAFPDAANRLTQTLDRPKLIYMVREPVSRAYAHWQQRIKTRQNVGYEVDPTHAETFEKAISRSNEYLAGSDYHRQLLRYLNCGIPLSRIQVIVFEEFAASPHHHLRMLAEFLGIAPEPFDEMEERKTNVAAEHFERHVRLELRRKLLQVPGTKALNEIVPVRMKEFGYTCLRRSIVGERICRQLTPPRMKGATRRELNEYFQPSVNRLEKLLGREFRAWRDG